MANRLADEDVFQTEGKAFCRRLWDENSKKLFEDVNRPLRYVWLANNQFSDITSLIPTAESFRIPDNNGMNRAAKRTTLQEFGMPAYNNNFIQIKSQISEAMVDYRPDVVNLDLCNHLDEDTIEQISSVLETVETGRKTILFASITQLSMRSIIGKRFPKYRRLAKSQEDITTIIDAMFFTHKIKGKIIEGFPLTYQMQSSRLRNMYSFGWELTK